MRSNLEDFEIVDAVDTADDLDKLARMARDFANAADVIYQGMIDRGFDATAQAVSIARDQVGEIGHALHVRALRFGRAIANGEL